MEKPHRRIELTLRLNADDESSLYHALRQIAFELDRKEIDVSTATTEPHVIVSGGPDSGYILELEVRPDMTHDRYFEQLELYIHQEKTVSKSQELP